MLDSLGTKKPSKDQIADYVNSTLAAGQVIPGYGHAFETSRSEIYGAKGICRIIYSRFGHGSGGMESL